MRSLSHVACLFPPPRSPPVSAGVLRGRRPGAQGQRDSELQVRSGEAAPAVQVDEGGARVRGLLLPDAE